MRYYENWESITVKTEMDKVTPPTAIANAFATCFKATRITGAVAHYVATADYFTISTALKMQRTDRKYWKISGYQRIEFNSGSQLDYRKDWFEVESDEDGYITLDKGEYYFYTWECAPATTIDYENIYDNVKVWIPYGTGGNIIKNTTKDLLGGDTYINSVTYNPSCERICGFRSKNTVWQDEIHSSTLEVLKIDPSWVITLKEIHKLKPLGIKLYTLTEKEGTTDEFNRGTYTLFEAVNNVITIPAGFYLLNGIEIAYKGTSTLAYQWAGKSLDNSYFDLGYVSDISKINMHSDSLPTKGQLNALSLLKDLPELTKERMINKPEVFTMAAWNNFLINHNLLETVINNNATINCKNYYKHNQQSLFEYFGTHNNLIPIWLADVTETDYLTFYNLVHSLREGISKIVLYKWSAQDKLTVINANVPGTRNKEYSSYTPNDTETTWGWNTGYYQTPWGGDVYATSWLKLPNNQTEFISTDASNAARCDFSLQYDPIDMQIYEWTPTAEALKGSVLISDILKRSKDCTNNAVYKSIITTNTYDVYKAYLLNVSNDWPHTKEEDTFVLKSYFGPDHWTKNASFPESQSQYGIMEFCYHIINKPCVKTVCTIKPETLRATRFDSCQNNITHWPTEGRPRQYTANTNFTVSDPIDIGTDQKLVLFDQTTSFPDQTTSFPDQTFPMEERYELSASMKIMLDGSAQTRYYLVLWL